MMMRKLMSIVFLLLVLIISLGVSVYIEASTTPKEGMEDATAGNQEVEGEDVTATEVTDMPPIDDMVVDAQVVPDEAPNGESSTFDVSPMEGTCTESMSNYK
jgi:predicted transcriptional regulator